MNQVRTFLLFAWLLVGFLIWEAWQQDYVYPKTAPALPASADAIGTEVEADPALPSLGGDTPAAPVDGATAAGPESAADSGQRVLVVTDVLKLEINTVGVRVERADLLRYRRSDQADAPPVTLLNYDNATFFAADSGWVGSGANSPTHQSVFTARGSEFRLDNGSDELRVPFEWTDNNGLRLTRELLFKRGSYRIDVIDTVRNEGSEVWRGKAYRQLLRTPPAPVGNGMTNPEAYSFVGAAWYSATEKFNKIKFDDIDPREPLKISGNQAWVGMLQHYFFAAWIPGAEETVAMETGIQRGRYLIRAVSPTIDVAPGAEHASTAKLYVGPKLQDQLAGVAPGLELSIDYGIFTIIAEPLFWLLSMFHSLTGNWGWAIILLVLLIKALFFKLSEAQYKSFAKMRQVQPRIESLKERYGDDRQKFNMAMMELYKKEKINPMGGCLPILVQIPVFISLYWVLLESVELRHAPFILWIQNLTAPDPYFVLPVLNLATMWLTQKLSPTPGMDPLQKKMMQAMPLVFGVMFAFFPAGLVLYWTVNGGLGLLQQWVITRRHGTPTKA